MSKKDQAKQTGFIYLITNQITGMQYVGQTRQGNPINRWSEHYRCAFFRNGDSYLYRSMRKCGIENFTFQIIESHIPLKDLDDRERFYIAKYDTFNNGYNATVGGQDVVGGMKIDISEDEIRKIIEEIRQENKTYAEIAREHNVTPNYICCINIGRTWHFDDLTYPISQRMVRADFSEKEIQQIYDELKNTDLQIMEIADIHGVSPSEIYRINIGDYAKHEDIEYPIRKVVKRRQLDLDAVKLAIEFLQKKNYTYQQISDALGLSPKQVFSLNHGKSYKDLSEQLGIREFPIRNFTLRGKRPSGPSKNNTSGVSGVTWNKQMEKWTAEITINKKRKYLGTFSRKEDAIKARKDAEKKRMEEDPQWIIPT